MHVQGRVRAPILHDRRMQLTDQRRFLGFTPSITRHARIRNRETYSKQTKTPIGFLEVHAAEGGWMADEKESCFVGAIPPSR